jgi:Regulator of ribonuclease activity B
MGFKILAMRPATSSRDTELWNVEAAIQQSIEFTTTREFTDQLARAAIRHSGTYDGWGTLV